MTVFFSVGAQYALGGSVYTAGSTVTLAGGAYNNAITNVFVQNPITVSSTGILSASVGSTAIGAVTMGSGSTALGVQGGNTNTIFGGLAMNGTGATTLFTTNQLNVLGTFSGATTAVTKQGVANLILGGASTYAGNIIVDQGALESRVGSTTSANEQLTSAGTISVSPGAALRVLSAANIGATVTTINTNNDGIGAFGLGYNGAVPASVSFSSTNTNVDGTLGVDVVGFSTALTQAGTKLYLGSTSGGNYTGTTFGCGHGQRLPPWHRRQHPPDRQPRSSPGQLRHRRRGLRHSGSQPHRQRRHRHPQHPERLLWRHDDQRQRRGPARQRGSPRIRSDLLQQRHAGSRTKPVSVSPPRLVCSSR